MPYRARKEKVQVEAAREGLVADMVRQFADPYAFVRELVQNGIDAGSSALEVRAQYTRDGQAIFSVEDDGLGMTREIIEGPLLTLFNSEKDGDDTKIGKYGVGFVSVFALEPEQVVVETWRADGESWLCRLYPDHSFDLEQAPPPRGVAASGTRVSLHKAVDGDTFQEHLRGVGASLKRWCRHARIPIHWTVERDDASHRERADTPLDLVAPVKVEAELDGARYVVGPGAGSRLLEEQAAAATFAGFYNRGLTLYETSSPPRGRLAGIRFKVDDAALQHTLSRDNVRHDAAYERVLEHVEDLVGGPLRTKLIETLAGAAEAVARGEGDALHYTAVLEAACNWRHLPRGAIRLPLTDRFHDAWTMSLAELRSEDLICFSDDKSRLTSAVTKHGRPVIRAVHPQLPEIVTGHPFERVDNVYLLVEQRKVKGAERNLLRHTRRALERAGLVITKLGMAGTGARPARAMVGVTSRGKIHLVQAETHPRWRRRLGPLPRLLLLDAHPAVKAAVRLAKRDAGAAGELLARYVLVEDRGELGKSESDALLAASAERLEATP